MTLGDGRWDWIVHIRSECEQSTEYVRWWPASLAGEKAVEHSPKLPWKWQKLSGESRDSRVCGSSQHAGASRPVRMADRAFAHPTGLAPTGAPAGRILRLESSHDPAAKP